LHVTGRVFSCRVDDGFALWLGLREAGAVLY
jgi:hypothetical protein